MALKNLEPAKALLHHLKNLLFRDQIMGSVEELAVAQSQEKQQN
ncbi:MAG: hypothetical protein ACI8Y7_000853 [Candidatus Woesearchaeota archaeon]|jgi:hypothetical protein